MMTTTKNYLIFGGIDGIGGALASRLNRQGHTIYVTTSSPEKAENAIASGSPKDSVLLADASSLDTITQAVQKRHPGA